MRSRILAVSAAVVLALPTLAACNDDGCDSNASAQVFAKPGGGSGGGGKGGGSKGGGKSGKSKGKTGGGGSYSDDDCDDD